MRLLFAASLLLAGCAAASRPMPQVLELVSATVEVNGEKRDVPALPPVKVLEGSWVGLCYKPDMSSVSFRALGTACPEGSVEPVIKEQQIVRGQK